MREAGEKNSQPVESAPSQGNDAGSFAVQPKAAEERGKSQDKNADREGQCDFGNTPPKLLRQRDTENAPSVDRAERDLQKHACNCDYPTIIRSHGSITTELSKCHSLETRRRSPCRS